MRDMKVEKREEEKRRKCRRGEVERGRKVRFIYMCGKESCDLAIERMDGEKGGLVYCECSLQDT